MHVSRPIFTAQFHPEAWGGPTDTEVRTEKRERFSVENSGVSSLMCSALISTFKT